MSINKQISITCDDEDGKPFFDIRTNGDLIEIEFLEVAGPVVLTSEMYETFVSAIQEFDNFMTEI